MALVCVLMGSESDKKLVVESGFVDILTKVIGDDEVEYSICSAHRNSEVLANYVEDATSCGTKLFIGIAGLAAALPGAIAGNSRMTVPVIGVPLDEHGIDSCLYMPPGVPVLTPGVGKTGLKNAALAACQIMAATSFQPEIHDRWMDYLSKESAKKLAQLKIDPRAKA